VSSTAVTGEASSAPQEMQFSVQGMTCAACAARVEKKLGTIDGVAATVNFATGHAIVAAPAAVPLRHFGAPAKRAGTGRGRIVPAGRTPVPDSPPGSPTAAT
jgi:Cu+-exporting ATPase